MREWQFVNFFFFTKCTKHNDLARRSHYISVMALCRESKYWSLICDLNGSSEETNEKSVKTNKMTNVISKIAIKKNAISQQVSQFKKRHCVIFLSWERQQHQEGPALPLSCFNRLLCCLIMYFKRLLIFTYMQSFTFQTTKRLKGIAGCN